MAKWNETANEAFFKPIAEGYVFKSPNPWFFARPRYYLVNEAQKAEIGARLGRWRLLLCTAMAALIVCVMLSPYMFNRLVGPANQLGLGTMILLAALVLAVLFFAVPQIYLMRALRPLLADAPRTNERITMREQLPKIVAVFPVWLLVVGLVIQLVSMGTGVFLLVDAFVKGDVVRDPLASLFYLVTGAMMTALIVYLIRLKAKLKRIAL